MRHKGPHLDTMDAVTGNLLAVTGGDESYQWKVLTAAQHSIALVAAFVREDAVPSPKPNKSARQESGAETSVSPI